MSTQNWFAVVGTLFFVWMGIMVAVAEAGNCTTNCQRTFNGGSTCNTYCY